MHSSFKLPVFLAFLFLKIFYLDHLHLSIPPRPSDTFADEPISGCIK